MNISDLNTIKNNALEQINTTNNLADLEKIRITLLGKEGSITALVKTLSQMTMEDKITFGQIINNIKTHVEEAINQHKTSLLTQATSSLNVDPSMPGHRPYVGHLHPTSIVIREMNEIFISMGFSIADGPEIENDEFNYNRLNLPKDHPARDLQDTLYIKEPDVLLRTHTSSIEAHILADFKPPYRFVIPGKVYRYENVSASNNIMFYQYQGLAVGEGINMSHLKGTLNEFVKRFFGTDTKTRFRCKYYPEVEPGVGVDISCVFCNGKGCNVCKHRGWIEMLGAGMIHPNMLKKVGLDVNHISGFAWGMGLDRIVMTKFGIDDVRSLYNGDIMY